MTEFFPMRHPQVFVPTGKLVMSFVTRVDDTYFKTIMFRDMRWWKETRQGIMVCRKDGMRTTFLWHNIKTFEIHPNGLDYIKYREEHPEPDTIVKCTTCHARHRTHDA